MRTLRYLFLLAIVIMLALVSCTVDKADGTDYAVSGHRVSISLRGGQMRTRAVANAAGFAREKAIANDGLFAVVFQADGTYYDTFSLAASETPNTYTFDILNPGAYYLYVVANPTITGFADKTYTCENTEFNTDEEAFLADVESADPGAGMSASTNFLMMSRRTLADIDADAVTNLGEVQMVRAAARIDIDASSITGLEITKVTVKNRYVKTKLARLGSDTSMPDGAKEATKEYVRGTGEGQLDATEENSTLALVSDTQWQGVIYGYENLVSGTDQDEITVIEITHNYGGVVSTTSVPFNNVPIKRNTLYTVTLTKNDAVPVQPISATITVTDWSSTEIAYNTTHDDTAPTFTVTSAHSKDQDVDPTLIRAKRTQDNSIQLTVTSQGSMGSEVTYQGGVVNGDNDFTHADYTAAQYTNGVNPISLTNTTYDANGHIVQTFTIAVPQALAQNMSSTDHLDFWVSNQYDDTHHLSFSIKSGYAMEATLSSSTVTYNGSAHTPGLASVTVYDDSNNPHSLTSSDYDVAYTDNVNAGTGHVTVTVKDGNTYAGASATVDFTINKATATLTLNPTSLSVKYGSGAPSKTITATLNHGELDGQAPTFTWNDGTHATIGDPTNFNGSHQSTITVTGVAEQKTDQALTVSAAETDNYTSASATCQIKVVNGVDAASLNLGDIIYDDGSVTANNAYNSNKHAIGVVVYKASSAEDACEAGVNAGHGVVAGRVLVISLADASTSAKWYTANSDDHNNSLFPNVNNNKATAQSDMQGYQKTVTLTTDGHTHAAATAAKNYTPSGATSTDYLEGSTGWFLPSIGQWMKVAGAMGVSTIPDAGSWSGAGSVATTLSNYITNAGGNASALVVNHTYWSSSEYDATYAQVVLWRADSSFGFLWGRNDKSNDFYVRAFLAY